MNNQTKLILPPTSGFVLSIGHLASIFSLLFILILILITLFIFFTKQKYVYTFDEQDRSTSGNERKSFEFRQSKRYSSTMNSQSHPSTNSFQMGIDEQNTRSTINLLSSK